jgi:hypothetical protein
LIDAKNYLRQILELPNRIKKKEKELFLLECLVTDTTASINNVAVQKSETSDKVGNCTAKILDLKAEIEQQKITAFEQIQNCIRVIEQVRDLPNRTAETQYNILHLRYVSGKTLKRIAFELKYDYDYIRELHGIALQNVNKIIEKK